jgi:hypothetical protein
LSLGEDTDQVVRSAVDAYLEGRLRAPFPGETVFETRNSRYRLMDGVLFSAQDGSLLGAELVGWLIGGQDADDAIVEGIWREGARAVLVDRNRGRCIVVTSTARLISSRTDGSAVTRGGSLEGRPNEERSVALPVIPKAPPSPPRTIPPCPPTPARLPQTFRGPPSSLSPATPPSPPTLVPRAIHAPPRPIANAAPPSSLGAPPLRPIAAQPPLPVHRPQRPLPAPAPPPRMPPLPAHWLPQGQGQQPQLPPPHRPPHAGPTLASPSRLAPPPVVLNVDEGEDDYDPTERHDRSALPMFRDQPNAVAHPPSAFPIPLSRRASPFS